MELTGSELVQLAAIGGTVAGAAFAVVRKSFQLIERRLSNVTEPIADPRNVCPWKDRDEVVELRLALRDTSRNVAALNNNLSVLVNRQGG